MINKIKTNNTSTILRILLGIFPFFIFSLIIIKFSCWLFSKPKSLFSSKVFFLSKKLVLDLIKVLSIKTLFTFVSSFTFIKELLEIFSLSVLNDWFSQKLKLSFNKIMFSYCCILHK